MNLIDAVVVPTLQHLSLCFTKCDDGIWLGFEVESGSFVCRITEQSVPPILWLRYFPELAIGPEDMQVMLAALTVNRCSWMLKIGCDPEDGEVVIDVELPLLHGEMTDGAFATYFRASTIVVVDLLALLQEVCNGRLMACEMAEHLRQQTLQRSSAWLRSSDVVREEETIIRQRAATDGSES